MCNVSGIHMQLTRTTTAKSDEHKHGNKYGNLPKNESGENTFGNFSAGSAR